METFSSKKELEFYLLKDLSNLDLSYIPDIDIENKIEKLKSKIMYRKDWMSLVKFWGVIEDKNIFIDSNNTYYVFKEGNFKKEKIYLEYPEKIFEVDKEILTDEFLDKIEKNEIEKVNLDFMEVLDNKEKFLKFIENIRKGKKEEEKQEEDEEKKDERELWNTESKYDGSILIEKNKFSGRWWKRWKEWKDVILKDKNFNEIYKYDDLPLLDYDNLIDKLVKEKISFKVEDNYNNDVEINFVDGKTLIEGVEVKNSKVKVILKNYKPNENKEKIRLLNNLGLMKVKILEKKEFNVGVGIDIEIDFSLVDENTFKVVIGDKEKNISWDKIKDCFYGKRKNISYYIDKFKFMDFCIKEMGFSKQEFFDYIKKVKVIKNL